ncbi:unnamed protein product [Blepharisma stoltei]|uniref:Uncharacterized protein n=1 Tax=Blepharisma stoltei TaxID=1481888 RepID=A0AAU9I7D1_9CILI|nr:unnamed protein product [Blepharisma stoltei]
MIIKRASSIIAQRIAFSVTSYRRSTSRIAIAIILIIIAFLHVAFFLTSRISNHIGIAAWSTWGILTVTEIIVTERPITFRITNPISQHISCAVSGAILASSHIVVASYDVASIIAGSS